MIRWRVAEQLEKRGWTAYRLAQEAGFSIPLAYRLVKSEPIQRIDAATLETLCRVFEVDPGELLAIEPAAKRGRR